MFLKSFSKNKVTFFMYCNLSKKPWVTKYLHRISMKLRIFESQEKEDFPLFSFYDVLDIDRKVEQN